MLGAVPVAGADFYFDSAATGSGSGSSWENAFTSANSDNWTGVGNGDTVWLKQGTHAQQFRLYNKTGVTVKIDPSATGQAIFTDGGQFASAVNCTIDGWLNGDQQIKVVGRSDSASGIATRPTFWIRDGNNIVLRGVEIAYALNNSVPTDAPSHGLSISQPPTPPVLVEYCEIHHVSGDGISISYQQPDNGTFDRVTIRDTHIHNVIDDGIQIAAVWGVTIDGCTIDHGSTYRGGEWGHPDGVQMSGTGGGSVAAGKLKIINSRIVGFTQSIFIEYAGGAVYIWNNEIVDDYNAEIYSAFGSAPNGGVTPAVHSTWVNGDSFIVANNTFYGFTWGSAFKGGSTLSTVTDLGGSVLFDNNIMMNCKTGGNDSSLNALLADTCLWYDAPGVQFYTSSGAETSAPASRHMGSALNLDPAFSDVGANDFTLTATSGAINAGADLSAYFTTDYAGNTRAAPWDIGAYEYQDASEAPPGVAASFAASAAAGSGAPTFLTLTWNGSGVTGHLGYKIERSLTASTGFVQVGTAAALAETYRDNDLTPGVQYYYRIRSYNATGNGDYSTEANATTPVISGRSVRPQSAGGAGLW